jgi:hypothetical protein
MIRFLKSLILFAPKRQISISISFSLCFKLQYTLKMKASLVTTYELYFRQVKLPTVPNLII